MYIKYVIVCYLIVFVFNIKMYDCEIIYGKMLVDIRFLFFGGMYFFEWIDIYFYLEIYFIKFFVKGVDL